MFVGVIHHIHDPERFRAAFVGARTAGLPEGFALTINAMSRDHRIAIGVWEGASVTAVRDVVEHAVGSFADNEYYEMEVDRLPPQRRP